MRTILILLISVFLTGVVAGQVSVDTDADRPTVEHRHRIGISALGILDRVVDTGNDVNDILITYQYHTPKFFLRAGIGPDYHFSQVTHEGFTDSVDSTNLKLDGRIGIGFCVIDDRRWNVSGGVDLVGKFHLNETVSDSGFDAVTDQYKTTGFGAGPFVTVNYQLGNRISLGTEAAVYATYSEETHTMLFKNFPDFNDEIDNTKTTGIEAFMPTTIFIQFHF